LWQLVNFIYQFILYFSLQNHEWNVAKVGLLGLLQINYNEFFIELKPAQTAGAIVFLQVSGK